MKKLIVRCCLIGLAVLAQSGCASVRHDAPSESSASESDFWNYLPHLQPGSYGSWTP
jgi:uncharacterized protein YceK